MEMTMATMGLLMKNFDMAVYLFSGLDWGLVSGFTSGFCAAPGSA
jgi:hypothetical protein